MDKMVNARITSKGNQLLFESDLVNRQLRMLKDNFNQMEILMREEIRHDYERTIVEKDN